ncbi:hypothetical protein [Clostridium estertheticum]|uniref:hypothetical protein n=1 Tax=Clostridium estertheticum TaxID=238834 RepID=UPI00217D2624|nr:hypothetical protein [Clostridium estertheticum]
MELWDILDANGEKTGKTVERRRPMGQDEYHLVVNVWIKIGMENFQLQDIARKAHSFRCGMDSIKHKHTHNRT